MHNKMEHNWAFGIGVIIAIGTAYGLSLIHISEPTRP